MLSSDPRGVGDKLSEHSCILLWEKVLVIVFFAKKKKGGSQNYSREGKKAKRWI